MAAAEWQNTGTFGPEQADLDVTYATSLPPEVALGWVEARIAEVQSHFANLGSKRNHLFPIYHLPKVVLFQILSWVALAAPPSKSGRDQPPRYHMDQTRDLIHVSHSCKLFRDAALERPELWVRVNLQCPSIAKMFLERSGDKPVTTFLNAPLGHVYPIRPPGPVPLKASTLEVLRPHLGRITVLDLTFTLQTRQGYGGENPLAMHMPALRTLQLRAIRKDEDSTGFYSNSDPSIAPPVVFPTPNELYPQLRRVVFTSVGVPWDSTLFHDLTELELAQQDSGPAPSLEEFLAVLERCPRLEKLFLNNAGPKEPSDPLVTADAKKVQLSHLRDLTIDHDEGRFMTIPLLLARVSIQPSTKIHIQCNEAVDPVIHFSLMFPPGHPFLAELPKYETLKHLHSFMSFHFRLIDEPSGGFLSFKVTRRDQNVKPTAAILDFFKVFGESVQFAEIYPGSGPDWNPWADVLGTLSNVEILRLKRELDHNAFAAALSTKICPKLKKISFEYHSHTADRQSAWLAAVKTRAANGMKLEEFNLIFSQGADLLKDDASKNFRSYVGKFSYERPGLQS